MGLRRMTTRIYCDGCDRDLRKEERNAFAVSWGGPEVKSENRAWDLCFTCLALYIKRHDPRNWPYKWQGLETEIENMRKA